MKLALLAALIICIVLIGGLFLGNAAIESLAMQAITTSLQGASK